MQPRHAGMLPRCQQADDGKCNRATDRRCASCRKSTCKAHLVAVNGFDVCWCCARKAGVHVEPG